MRTSYIPKTTYRAAIDSTSLYVFDDLNDKLILSISSIAPSKEEMKIRDFDTVEEFFKVEIQRIVAEELQLDTVDLHALIA